MKPIRTRTRNWSIFLLICAAINARAFDYSHAYSYLTHENFRYGLNVTKSIITFYPSFPLNRAYYGKVYSFDLIMQSEQSNLGLRGPVVERDGSGQITRIDDGLGIPILLSTIPYQQAHFEEVKKTIKSENFVIYSFNLDFERRWSNLYDLAKKNPGITVKLYPTVDYTAPSKVDLLRFVLDLFYREAPGLVQCRAGQGRSATAVGAYLMLIGFMAGQQPEVDEIEKYLKGKRSRVSFNASHRQALIEI